MTFALAVRDIAKHHTCARRLNIGSKTRAGRSVLGRRLHNIIECTRVFILLVIRIGHRHGLPSIRFRRAFNSVQLLCVSNGRYNTNRIYVII